MGEKGADRQLGGKPRKKILRVDSPYVLPTRVMTPFGMATRTFHATMELFCLGRMNCSPRG